MNKMDKDVFKSDCRIYLYHKKLIEEINDKKKNLLNNNIHKLLANNPNLLQQAEVQKYINILELKHLNESIKSTEKMFEDIEKEYGEEIKEILWKQFIERKTQKEIAKELNIAERTFQRRVKKIFSRVFNE